MNVLTVDVGGTHVKVLASGQDDPRKFVSGPALTPAQLVRRLKKLAADWRYDVASIAYPGPVLHGKPVAEPHNLGSGWVGFDYEAALGCPVKMINDAAMQALGSYRSGRMLFLGFGMGLGTTLITDGAIAPMELGHLPYRKAMYEDYVGLRGLKKYGPRKWREYVADVVERLIAALEPEDVVLGGGNVKRLKELPAGCRTGDNANAFVGGFRLWDTRPIQCASGFAMPVLGPAVAIKWARAGKSLQQRPVWKKLQAHSQNIRFAHLRTLFHDDPKRGNRLTAEAAGIFLDYSKQRITDETLKLLIKLAEDVELQAHIEAMFLGEKINITEGRAVLHVALRAPRESSILVDGVNVVPQVHAVLDKMTDFANRVRSGEWKGHTGKRIRNVINIGIGGSDLGPVMAYEALKHYSDRSMTVRFVSNIDGTDLMEATADLDRGRDTIHRIVKNIYDAGIDDQRPQCARVAAAGLWQ